MRRDFQADEKGAHNLPLIILFGVVLTLLMAILFISVYDQQLSARVDEQAESLADELAQAAFTSLSGGQPTIELPKDLGGSTYSISLQENSVFVVRISAGRRSGASYSAVVNAIVTVEDGDFSPGGRAFFMRGVDKIIVSAAPIEAIVENIIQAPSVEPPSFYYFSKHSPNEAAAIAAAYFDAKTRYPGENVDVLSYSWESANSLLARIRRGSGEIITRVSGSENGTGIGIIKTAWVVEQLESTGEISGVISCPSPDNAYSNGWLYSPQATLKHLRSRTWNRTSDDTVVAVPANSIVQASSVTTNISKYPAWRVKFGEYTLFYQMLPWWEMENTAGFVFQSYPELKPII
ncbi:MAG: hypothetical protein ABH852_02300 [Methanobacteriota archaeon]